ncbi:MAG: hypothetical protein DRP47_01065 [Candidatus Zixiibacteriota bacterium]|nr:MAG: hypothetical protein DRP47_01065 [candidate division Zixibacteria bacterium]
MVSLRICLLVVVLMTGFQPISYADPDLSKPKQASKLQSQNNADLISLARRLIQQKDYQGAASFLEIVYERQPDISVVINLLRHCYDQLGQYSKSEILIRRLLESSPKDQILHLFLAEALAKQDNLEQAKETYQRAIELVAPNDTVRYRGIVRSMEQYGFEQEGLRLIASTREKIANSRLMALDAGRILESLQRYTEAAEEYFIALDDTSRSGTEAESRLLNLLTFADAGNEVEEVLRKKIGDVPQARAARLLSTHYLKAGRGREAFKYARLQDSLEDGKGHALLHYIRACQERKLYSEAVDAASWVLPIYGYQAIFDETYFIYADALVHLGEFDKAISVYDTIVARFPRIQDKAIAGYQIGNIYLNYLNDYQSALEIFDSVATQYRAGNGYMKAILTAPHCLLRQGDLKKAHIKFESLTKQSLNDESMEAVHFYLGLIKFMEMEFDSSKAAFNKLLVEYPRGFYVNNALSLMLILEEAGDVPVLLKLYSRALLYEQQRLSDSAISTLEELATATDPTLSDVALYKLSRLSLEKSDSSAVIGYVDRLTEQFPESYYLPYGLKLKADILLENTDSNKTGREIYRHLLETYPNYPFTSEIRKHLRELEESNPIGYLKNSNEYHLLKKLS